MVSKNILPTEVDVARQIEYQRATAGVLKTYNIYEVDLGVARTNVSLGIAGDNLVVLVLTGSASIRLTDVRNDAIPLSLSLRLRKPTPFSNLYITNTLQPGATLTIAIGRDAELEGPQVNGIINASGVQISPATEATLAKVIPLALATVAPATAYAGAAADMLAAAVGPTNTPATIRITIALSVAQVVTLRYRRAAGAFQSVLLNSGAPLVANGIYTFDIPSRNGDTINLQGPSACNILVLNIDEIGGAA